MPTRKTAAKPAQRARPYRREARYTRTMSLPLEQSMLDAVHAVADAHEKSPVAVVRECIAAGLPTVRRRLGRKADA